MYDKQFTQTIRKACQQMQENPTFASINYKMILQQIQKQNHFSLQQKQHHYPQEVYSKKTKPSELFKFDKDNQDYQEQEQEENQNKVVYIEVKSGQDKFITLGRNIKGQKIYKISDFYLAQNNIVEEIYKRRIGKLIDLQRKKKRDDPILQESLLKVLNKYFQNLDGLADYSLKQQKKITLEQLQEIIYQTGESRKNFFLHYRNTGHISSQKPAYNPYLSNPLFISKLKRIAKTYQTKNSIDSRINIQQNMNLWGVIQQEKKQKIGFVIQDDDDKQAQQQLLKDELFRKFNYYNPQLQQGWKKPLWQLKRVQIDLNTPGLQLQKLQNFYRKKKEQFQLPPPQREKPKSCRGVRHKQMNDKKKQDQSQLDKSSFPIPISIPKDSTTQSTLMDILLQYRKNQKQPTNISHSQVAKRLRFVKFVIDALQFKDFHRYYYSHIDHLSPVTLIKSAQRKPKMQGLKINHQAIDSYQKFNSPSSLSAKQGSITLIEQIQQNPLMLTDPGMCSKIVMHVDYNRMNNLLAAKALRKPQFQQIQGKKGSDLLVGDYGLNLFRQQLFQKFGSLGTLYLQQNGKTGLLGHTDDVGVTVLQNRMYGQVIVKQTPSQRDFLLFKSYDGKWHLRKFNHLYLAGQIQPRMDFFSPDSRSISSFLTNYLKSFIKLTFQNNSTLNFDTLRDTFRTINQHNIRKTLKSLHAQTADSRMYSATVKYDRQLDVTPQQVCLYQKMQNTLYLYKMMGIQLLRVPDKLKQIVALHFKKYPQDLKKYVLAKIICDQLHTCPWYLTQSYKSSQQGQGKLQLQGIGDPTNGRGGISFIKRPQKKRVQKQQQIDEDKDVKGVTGTNADLRKLKNQIAQKMLLDLGLSQEEVNNMNRWQKVFKLKQIASKYDSNRSQILKRFRRQQRATKKMKKQAYQKQIDKLFNILVKNLTASQIGQDEIAQIESNLCPLTIEQYMGQQRLSYQDKLNRLKVKQKIEESDFDDDQFDS